MSRAVALLLTAVTGFTGLVYEVTWQKYMATLLGSHSEAAAAVLGIFLAGLSIGYSLFGRLTQALIDRARRTSRPARLFLAYGLVEATIGFYALAFPWLFEAVRSASLMIPHAAGGVGFAFDVTLVAAMLAPPTILMGGTIPILTQALAHDLDDATRFHALVYGSNTIGAFVGALAASFVLIPALGLHGSMMWMSVLNLAAGAAFALFERSREAARRAPPEAVPGRQPADGGLHQRALYAWVAFLAGFALMVLQNVFIRLGGLALGPSEFTFATVVAVFVLCIALGSFAVSLMPKIPDLALLLNQCALVGYLAFLYLHLEKLPLWAYVLRSRFGSGEEDFLPFHAAGFLAFFAIIGPAAILSGAVLPLLFHHLRRGAGDFGAIAGRLYSWNTLGSLIGALIGGYALLSVLDLHHVYRIAVGALAVAAMLLAARLLSRTAALATVAAMALALAGLASFSPWNPVYSSWGLFRHRGAPDTSFAAIDAQADALIRDETRRVIYHDDDPIASIAVLELARGNGAFSRSIVSNGKGDGDTQGDYTTMSLEALIPSALVERAERVFVVGFGTGISIGEFASLHSVKHVRVAEISPAVIAAAPLFDFANRGVSTSPKVEIVATDAYRSLMQGDDRYDVILSNPPNPWVTGVEMLFSREFLSAARDRLAPGGIYAQWYHQYETDEEAVALVLRTFSSVFDRVAVWYGLGADLIVLGWGDGDLLPTPEALARRIEEPDFAAGLRRSGVTSLPALLAHELLPAGVVEASALTGPLHSLYRPILNHVAGRAFFRGAAGRLPSIRSGRAAAVGARNSLLRRHLARLSGDALESDLGDATREACRMRKTLCVALLLEWQRLAPKSARLHELRRGLNDLAAARYGGEIRHEVLERLARVTAAPPQSIVPVPYRRANEATQLYRWFYQYPAPFDPGRLVAMWKGCRASPGRDGPCAEGLAEARRLEWPH